MSMRSCLLMLLAAVPAVAVADAPNLGQPLSESEVEAANYVVMPDGQGLPEGSGTAVEGAAHFQAHCQACHGARGEGGINDRLAGGHGTLAGSAPVKTVGSYWPYATTVFDYIRRAMPYTAPGTLENDQIYAITAYLLYVNDIVGEADVIDAETLPEVAMPNRDGFQWAWGTAD